MIDSTQRFSNRVDNYVKYRPSYPAGVIELLKAECGLGAGTVVADIGSGTGIWSQLLLEQGATVYAVEPNREMRTAAEAQLAHDRHFNSLAATAEDTTLPLHSIDIITASQAFHWFNHSQARVEWERILRPEGWVVLIWNDRRTDGSPFLIAYEQLLRTYSTDYQAVNHRWVDRGVLDSFFEPTGYRCKTFQNQQIFDYVSLQGRLLSSSYAPEAGHPNHEAMLVALKDIFETHQVSGFVTFPYDTSVYYGHLAAAVFD